MFTRAAIQALVDEQATIGHTVSILAPYTFELRPVGFRDSEPNYRVLAERAAFKLRVTVVPDYLAVAIVAAVVAGAANNPARVDRLVEDLSTLGWDGDVDLSTNGLRIRATRVDTPGVDEEELAALATSGALLLSEFVIDQLVTTRPLGEMRAAVERPISDEPSIDPWLYDPSERDRSTQVHRSLENWLIASLRESGLDPLDPAGEPFFDVAWNAGGVLFVCEVKSSANSEVHQLRLGLGQVLQYRHALERSGIKVVQPVLLIEQEPRSGEWMKICARNGVILFWPTLWAEVGLTLMSGGRWTS